MISHAPSDTRPAWTSALPRLLTGLALLGVAMIGTAVVGPGLALRTSGADHPDYLVIAGTGVVMITLSSLFLAYASRVIGLGVAWLGLALLSNALILVGKVVLAPFAFYQTTFVAGDPFMNVQSPAFFPTLAAGVFVAQAAALGLLYAWARGRVTRALGQERSAFRRADLVVGLLTVSVELVVTVLLLWGLSVVGYGMCVVDAHGAER